LAYPGSRHVGKYIEQDGALWDYNAVAAGCLMEDEETFYHVSNR
jgi:hypothetical protein